MGEGCEIRSGLEDQIGGNGEDEAWKMSQREGEGRSCCRGDGLGCWEIRRGADGSVLVEGEDEEWEAEMVG